MDQTKKPKNRLQSKTDSELLEKEKKPSTVKNKTLFDHINHIRETKKDSYYEDLNEQEKKQFNKYTLIIGLSMDKDSIENVSFISKYFDSIPNKNFYKVCCDLVPKGKKYCKWIKSTKSKINNDLLNLISNHFKISKQESSEYCKILYEKEYGLEYLTDLCKKYGKNEKEIEKLLSYE
jgi:Bacteriophage clamp loader A subunit